MLLWRGLTLTRIVRLTLTFCTLVAVTRTIRPVLLVGAWYVTVLPVALDSVPTAPGSRLHVTPALKLPVPVTAAVKVVLSDSRSATRDAVTVTPVTVGLGATAPTLRLTSADLLESCTLVARITVTLEAFRLGAVKVTLAPVVALKVPPPLTMLQLTPLPNAPVPVTVALKAVVAAASRVLEAALTVTAVIVDGIGGTWLTVIVAVPLTAGLLALTAVKVTTVAVCTTGAVKVLTLPCVFSNVPALAVQLMVRSNSSVPETSLETL